jgi:hypothetical protein
VCGLFFGEEGSVVIHISGSGLVCLWLFICVGFGGGYLVFFV